MNLPGRVEENFISLESNFSCPTRYRGGRGKFLHSLWRLSLVLVVRMCTCCTYVASHSPSSLALWKPDGSWSRSSRPQKWGWDALWMESLNLRGIILFPPPSLAPLLLPKTKSQFQRYSLSLCVAQILFFFFLICNCNFVCSKSSGCQIL